MVNDISLVIEERMPEQNARSNLRRAHEPYEMCAIGQNAGGEKRIQQEYARPVWKVAAAKSARRSLKISFRTEYSGEGIQNARSVSSIRSQLKPFHLPEDVKYT